MDPLDHTLTAPHDEDSGPVLPAPATAFSRGALVDRFIILDELGAGGMGRVYKAYDPELDRNIAIKVLLKGGAAPNRLRREAQAIAQLSHPNVVTVHDVGRAGNDLFIAMEYVAGRTLDRWLGEARRSTAEIVEVFAQAARGLCAAHDQDIVHRDFKPSNVLIDEGGVVRVLDFGLARAETDEQLEPMHPGPLGETITRTGALIGTPKYMAPEQHTGERLDARADQFAFCVSLHEALFGHSPFEGETLEELRANVLAGKLAPLSARAPIPKWLAALLQRGLQLRPQDRFASMRGILAELERDRRASRRRLAWAGTLAVAIGVSAIVGLSRESVVDPCARTAAGADLVWTDDQRRSMRAGFAAAGVDDPDALFSSVDQRLNAYLDDWRGRRTAACRATHREGAQSGELFDRQVACFDRRLGEVGALVRAIGPEPSLRTTRNTVGAAENLSKLDACEDADELLQSVPYPENHEERRRVLAIFAQLDEGFRQYDLVNDDDAMQLAESALADARRIGYQPAIAEAHALLSALYHEKNDTEMTIEHQRALLLAAAKAGDDKRMGDAMAGMLNSMGGEQGKRLQEARFLIPFAEAAAFRSGDDDIISRMWNNSGIVLDRSGEKREALRRYQMAVEFKERAFGAHSTAVARGYDNVGHILGQLDRPEEAVGFHEKALAIKTKELGQDHPKLAITLTNLGMMYLQVGRTNEALETLRRALRVMRKRPTTYWLVAIANMELGEAHLSAGHLEEARAFAEKALVGLKDGLGPSSEYFAKCHDLLGRLSAAQGRHDAAVRELQASIRLHEDNNRAQSHHMIRPLVAYGASLEAQEQFHAATKIYERAVAIGEQQESDDAERYALLALARLLETRGGSERRAAELAEKARSAFAKRGLRDQAQYEEATALVEKLAAAR